MTEMGAFTRAEKAERQAEEYRIGREAARADYDRILPELAKARQAEALLSRCDDTLETALSALSDRGSVADASTSVRATLKALRAAYPGLHTAAMLARVSK